MRVKMKRFLGILLSLTLVLGLMPGMGLTAYAADEVSENISLVASRSARLSTITGTHYSVSCGEADEVGMSVNSFDAMTISARKGETITKVVLIYEWDSNKNTLSVSSGTFDGDATFSGINSQNVTISSSSTAGVNVAAVTVYFEGSLSNPTVTLTGGANAKSSGGLLTQSYLPGAMDTVTYTALTGAAFPEFETFTQNGVTVERTSDTVVTISGTPTANTAITVPDAESSSKIVTWDSSIINDSGSNGIRVQLDRYNSYSDTANGITLTKSGDAFFSDGYLSLSGDATLNFSTATGKFTSIEIETSQIYDGGNWTAVGNTLKWNGTPSNSVSLSGNGLFLAGVSSINFVIEMPAVSVTVIAGDNMTKTTDSGAASQADLPGPMTAVVYTGDDGYYFPEDYSVAAVHGISVTRDSYTQITVSGTPSADATITLTAPTAKTTPAAPTTAAAVDCTTAANNDGKLTGVTTAMEYKKSDAENWTAGTGSDITGLVPGTYYVRVKATETTNASGNQELTVKGFISYTVTFKVVNGKWNEGEGDAATADKTVTLTGHDGDTLKLTADQIPAVGTKPNDTYMAGSWDVTPSADTEITADTTYTYTYAAREASVVAKAPEAKTLTYSGSAQELVTAGEATGGTMQYALGNETEATQPYTTSIPTATEAGTYHVWYKAVGDDTHNDSTPVRVDVTINKADSEPKEVNANNWIYDGTPHELVTINQPQLQKKITLLKTVSSLVPFNIRISEEKVATDDKEAIDTIEESKYENQKVEEAKSEEVVENKDTSDESKAETEETKSDSQQPESQEVVEEKDTNEQVENIESENSDQNNSELSEEIIIQNSLVLDEGLTSTDSDDHTESVQQEDNNSEETKVEETNDQEGDKTVSVEETNDEAVETKNTDTEVVDSTDKSTEETQQEDTSVKEENKEEAQQDVQEEGPVLKFVVGDNNKSAPSEGWNSEIPSRKNAGTYYVWYKVFGDSNHKDSEAACVTVTVSKATATIKVKDKTIYVGDTVPALDGSDFYTVTGLCGEDTLTAVPTLAYQKSGEVVSPDSSKAGEYDIVASGADAGDNYNITYEKGKLTISETAKADTDIVPSEDAPSILSTKPEISNELAEQAAKIAEADGSKVELKLTVKADEESKVSESTVLNQKPQMKLQVQSQFKDEDTVKVDVVDIDIKQIINGSDKGTLTETNSVLEIGIGYDFTGKYDPVVVREHDGTSQAFRALEARPSSGNYVDGTFFADTANNKLYIYSRLFSQYVIAYSTVEGNAQNRVASTTSSSSGKTPEVSTVPVYRLFNAKIGYHFFTANVAEKNALVAAGWTDEGIAWQVQPKAGKPVYRLFDKTRGMHVFTADATEKATLIAAGAVDEGIAWYGHEAGRTVYKVTNPKVNRALYTTSVAEKDALAATGFTVEEANFKVN